MTLQLNIDKNFDGIATVNGEEVIVVNALAQGSNLRDEDYQPSAAAVEAVQTAVDAEYQRINRCL